MKHNNKVQQKNVSIDTDYYTKPEILSIIKAETQDFEYNYGFLLIVNNDVKKFTALEIYNFIDKELSFRWDTFELRKVLEKGDELKVTLDDYHMYVTVLKTKLTNAEYIVKL